VPIVALTANVMASERERYLAAGMDGHVMKPVDWGDLFAAWPATAAGPRRQARRGRSRRGPPRAGRGGGRPPPEAPAREPPLLDRGLLDRLGATLPAEAFAGLVRRGIENAERACARLPALPAGSEEQVREAHSLKGTAGTFGLRRVSAVAGEIEAAATNGREVSGWSGGSRRRWRPRGPSCARPGCCRGEPLSPAADGPGGPGSHSEPDAAVALARPTSDPSKIA
jgi:hypothetical protein